MSEFRIEKDTMGDVQVPAHALWGAQTQRSTENFKIGGDRFPREMIKALGVLKKCAAMTNAELGLLDKAKAEFIVKAADEVISGKLDQHFPLVVWQTGSGTQTNMNANEVLANIALEMSGHKKGEYAIIDPHDHLNMSQSTNDVYPTAARLAAIFANMELVTELERLSEAFARKGHEFKSIRKLGRTQLQDAVPMTLGEEFLAYATTIEIHLRSALGDMDLPPMPVPVDYVLT